MAHEEFKVGHEVHGRVPWPNDNTKSACIKLPTSIIQLITHNEPTTPQEAEEIKMLRSEVENSYAMNEQEKQSVQDEIRRTQEHLENLHKKLETIADGRIELDKQTIVYDTILSPFRRLPYDILHRIIQECINAAEKAQDRSRLTPQLMRVSRSFCHIIQATPSLWNNIYLRCVEHQWLRSVPSTMSSYKHHVNLWSNMSRELPIYAEIEEGRVFLMRSMKRERSHPTVGPNTVAWMLSQWEQRHRLATLSIRVESPPFFMTSLVSSLEQDNPSVPNLRAILLSDTALSLARMPEAPSINALLQMLPQARHLVLSFNLDESPFIQSLQVGAAHDTQGWSNLTTLQMQRDTTSSQLVLVLSLCPNLKAASFHMCIREDDELPQTTLTHHHLSELIIKHTYYKEDSTLFSGLRLPALVSLKVHLGGIGSNEWLPEIQDVDLLFPSVQRLDLMNETSANLIQLYYFLNLVPSTTSLTLSLRPTNAPQFAWFLEQSEESTGEKIFLPHLGQLNIRLYLTSKEWSNPDGLMDSLKALLDTHRYGQDQAVTNVSKDAFNISIRVMSFNREKSSSTQMEQFLTKLQSEFRARGVSLEVALEHESPEEYYRWSQDKYIQKHFFDL
ncbi:hypothetical protein BJ165DRAFT_1528343 [Panaeolus papilionaceus]|nr:hypothetical protein BJ165DRAFT_1528343 [Panaeolus papilionaceus]